MKHLRLLLFVISLTCTFQNAFAEELKNEAYSYDNYDYDDKETNDETSRFDKASQEEDEASQYGETSRYGETSGYEVAENGEERVFIGVNSVFQFIANPSSQATFLLRMFGQVRMYKNRARVMLQRLL
jgi:hypothetical protein